MSLPVYVVASLAGARPGDRLVLDGDEGRHAVVVRRTRPGERVVLTDGRGAAATCRVEEVERAQLSALVERLDVHAPESPRVVVVQAIPKGDRGELAVEMLTEVGVDVIVPWAAARSVALWRGDRAARSLARWRATATQAAKQSRRSWFPTVTDLHDTDQVVELLRGASVRVVLHEAASGPLADLPVPGRGEIVVVVGPEGGLASEELEAFAAVGAEAVRMGSSVLRTSTAGVAATAALLSRSPRWR